MTVGIGIKCTDGMVLACDSMATFGRGVPILRYTNKVHILSHKQLQNPIGIIGAGMVTYFHKFRDRALRGAIDTVAQKQKRKLDVLDFCEGVAEPIVSSLLKDYAIDRAGFFGGPIVEYSLSLILAGLTADNEIRGYFVHPEGVSEPFEYYGTTGSGAAYAELFLRYLLAEPEIDTIQGGKLAIYAVKGVELMDPNVGGQTNVVILTSQNGKLQINDFPAEHRPTAAKETMERVLGKLGASIQSLLDKGGNNGKNKR